MLKSMPLSRQLRSLLERVFALAPEERISIQEFQIEISQIRYFTLRGFKLEEFEHERYRVHDISKLYYSPHTQSIHMAVVPEDVLTDNITEEESVDITEASKDYYFILATQKYAICRVSGAALRL
jgi:hypothetical protein